MAWHSGLISYTQKAEGEDHWEFEASLGYIVSTRAVRAES